MKPLVQLKQEFYKEALPIFSEIGWQLKADHSEVTPSGKEWASDFIATFGNMRMAIFFMDLQEDDEDLFSDENIRLREQQYALVSESKVRGLWLYDSDVTYTESRYGHDFRIPLMGLAFPRNGDIGEENQIRTMSVGGYFRPQDESEVMDGVLFDYIAFEDFIEGLLIDRSFTWSLKRSEILLLAPVVTQRDCWKCKKPTLVCKEFHYLKHLPPANGEASVHFVDRMNIQDVPETHLISFNRQNKSRATSIGEIKMRYSRTVGDKYMSNGCVHCDALQGAFFTGRSLSPAVCELTYAVAVMVEGNESKHGHWVQLDWIP